MEAILGLQIRTILAIFDLQVIPMLPTQFRVNWVFCSGKEVKIDFHDGHHGSHLGFMTGTILAFFWSTSHPDASYHVSSQLAFRFRRRKNGFSRWLPWWPSWISDQNDFSYFLSTSHPNDSYPFKSIGLLGQEKKWKINFQDGPYGGQLGFPIGSILAFFDLPVIQMLPTKFRINWPFGSGEEVKNRFSRWLPWWPSWISDQNDFSYFLSTSDPNDSYQVSSQLAFQFKRRSEK